MPSPHFQWVCDYLRTSGLDLVVISMGENFAGWRFVDIARSAGLPYAIICQKASICSGPPTSFGDGCGTPILGRRRVTSSPVITATEPSGKSASVC